MPVPSPRSRRRGSLAAAAVLVVLCALLLAPGGAGASPYLKIGIADDATVLFDQDNAPAIVAQWAASGIETVRIHVRWVAVVPDPESPSMPMGFDPANPDDPGYHWGRIDRAIEIVREAGLTPMLVPTGSGPLWASRFPALGNPRYLPDPGAFAAFATAVARRYGRVTRQYLIWNEPNQPLWLQPQQECRAVGKCTPVAPHSYRDLLRQAYPAIHAADPDAEVIGGTLAPRGIKPLRRNNQLRPLAFLRAFGCVDERLQPVRTGRCRDFRPAMMDGFAYHPHPVDVSPTTQSKEADDAAIGDLGKLEAVLDGIQDAGGFLTPNGRRVPLHFTEFGYQTNPPDGHDGISPAKQSRWLQESAYLAWRDPRVKTLIEYEWKDEPVRNLGAGQRAFAGWQSGLFYNDGRAKPAFAGFLHPFFADMSVAAPKVRFWGQVRPGAAHPVVLQRRSPAGAWVTIKRLTTDRRGTFAVALKVPARRAAYRFRTTDVVPAALGRGAATPQVSDVLSVTPLKTKPPRPPRWAPPAPPAP